MLQDSFKKNPSVESKTMTGYTPRFTIHLKNRSAENEAYKEEDFNTPSI